MDWVDQTLLGDGLPGRLGLTILPGKRGTSVRYPGLVYRRDARTDLERLRRLGADLLVLLVEDRELERWGDLAFVEHATAAGLRVRRLPIRDGHPPASVAVDELLDEIHAARAKADVVVACMGGGTVGDDCRVRARRRWSVRRSGYRARPSRAAPYRC